jgi:hypothetical protein
LSESSRPTLSQRGLRLDNSNNPRITGIKFGAPVYTLYRRSGEPVQSFCKRAQRCKRAPVWLRHTGACACRCGGIQLHARTASPERHCTGGTAEGAEQRRWVGGAEAGPRDRPGAPRTMEGWWGRGGRLASGFGSALPTQRQGRAIRCRAAHRARTRARGAAKCGQFAGTSNEPFFAAIGARGAAPRRLQCARDHA